MGKQEGRPVSLQLRRLVGFWLLFLLLELVIYSAAHPSDITSPATPPPVRIGMPPAISTVWTLRHRSRMKSWGSDGGGSASMSEARKAMEISLPESASPTPRSHAVPPPDGSRGRNGTTTAMAVAAPGQNWTRIRNSERVSGEDANVLEGRDEEEANGMRGGRESAFNEGVMRKEVTDRALLHTPSFPILFGTTGTKGGGWHDDLASDKARGFRQQWKIQQHQLEKRIPIRKGGSTSHSRDADAVELGAASRGLRGGGSSLDSMQNLVKDTCPASSIPKHQDFPFPSRWTPISQIPSWVFNLRSPPITKKFLPYRSVHIKRSFDNCCRPLKPKDPLWVVCDSDFWNYTTKTYWNTDMKTLNDVASNFHSNFHCVYNIAWTDCGPEFERAVCCKSIAGYCNDGDKVVDCWEDLLSHRTTTTTEKTTSTTTLVTESVVNSTITEATMQSTMAAEENYGTTTEHAWRLGSRNRILSGGLAVGGGIVGSVIYTLTSGTWIDNANVFLRAATKSPLHIGGQLRGFPLGASGQSRGYLFGAHGHSRLYAADEARDWQINSPNGPCQHHANAPAKDSPFHARDFKDIIPKGTLKDLDDGIQDCVNNIADVVENLTELFESEEPTPNLFGAEGSDEFWDALDENDL